MDEKNNWLYQKILQEIIEVPINKNEAKEKLKEIIGSCQVVRIRADAPDNGSIKGSIERFLRDKEIEGVSDFTIKSYKIQLDIFLEFFKEKKIHDITGNDIKDFFDYREKKYNITSKSSMETIRQALNVFFEWLVTENIIISSPMSSIKPFKVPYSDIEPLNVSELNALRNACNTARERALLEVFISTGCTLDEISNLLIEDINWNNKTIKVKGASKQRNRLVFLTELALQKYREYLSSRSDKCNFLFVTERKPYRKLTRRTIQREINNIAVRTSIKKPVSPKILRHTFANLMYEKGCPLNILQTLLGNKDHSSTAETYIKINNRNAQDIYQKYFKG